ncbi:sulfate transporter [Gigaspora margarita]|uniref:Sulfate transporter n=1 Tax=Gigaspora margarita TaxID=4874 RepID=A0A8H3XN18_GIGMA|nr:sulfate transporter [Gigaspora margarita]
MSSHEIVQVIEPSDPQDSNRDVSLWHNPLLYLYSSSKERTQYIIKNASLSELSGSLGDLGTLLPILVSLAITGQISLTSSFIFGGLWNIISGFMFRIPMCVQPMKAIAAVALSAHLTKGEVLSAGIGVGAMIFALGITRTIRLVGNWTPIPIIRGIQLGAGITLIIKAAALVNQRSKWGGSSWEWSDNYEWALISFIFVFIFYSSRRIPTALILFILGLIIALVKAINKKTLPSISFNYPEVDVPTLTEFKNGFLSASLGQLPLTALNSVIALASLAEDLFPKWSRLVTVEKISVSIGFMNLIGCFFGSMPYCHGSGGLAGQYRFGARSEVSILILGLFKLLVGILFGGTLTSLLNYFPLSILGVMLFVSGLELSVAARNYSDTNNYDDETKKNSNTDNDNNNDETTKKNDNDKKNSNADNDNDNDNDNDGITKNNSNIDNGDERIKRRDRDFTLMVITAGLLVGFSNDGIGYVGGMIVSLLFFIYNFFNRKFSQSSSIV